MSVTVHQRPGVYSSYEASALVHGNGAGGVVGLAAVHATAEAGVQVVTGYEQAVSAYGIDHAVTEWARLALANGAAAVAVSTVTSESSYETAFAALEGLEDVKVVICGSTTLSVQQNLRDSVAAASAARRERVAVVAGAAGEEVEALVTRAAGLNHERVVLVAPGGVDQSGTACAGLGVAAALAGAIAGELDPALPLGGAELKGLYGLEVQYRDNELDRLILNGVTPVENVGGVLGVVRGVTTRTTTDGAADPTWRELSTIRIVDDVISGLRDTLRAKFRRAKNTPQSRGAIRAQVVLELENKLAREIIAGYEGVAVTADSADPTRCLVDFAFTVAHGLNQIWLTAHITV